MANQNRSKKAFDSTKSNRATEMMNMSDNEIFERYFIKDDGVFWLDDFNRIKIEVDENNKDKYPKILSLALASEPLRVICTIIHKRLLAEYTPAGYKFNARNFIEDLEAILNDNQLQSLDATGTAQANEFIVQLSNFFVETLYKGIHYQSSLAINQI